MAEHEQLLKGVWGQDNSGGSSPERTNVKRLRRRGFSNISFTIGAVVGSTSRVGRSLGLSCTLIFLASDDLLSQILAVEFVYVLNDPFKQPAGVVVLGLIGNGHHPDALAPQVGLEGHGVLALPGETAVLPYEDDLEGVFDLLPFSIISLDWGPDGARPLSASSMYSRATGSRWPWRRASPA